jgi:hypothetical protein
MSGQGILVTTVRRKERKAGLELIEFLDDLVSKLYPDLDLSIPEPEPEAEVAETGGDDDDDSLDALKNGMPDAIATSSSSRQPQEELKVPKEAPAAAAATSKSNDIEAQIQAELAELNNPHKRQQHTATTSSNDDGNTDNSTMSRPRKREKFRLVDPQVECLMFVKVAWPMDPVTLCCALLEQIEKNGQVRGKCIQRLSPIYETNRAEPEKIDTLARSVFAKYFPNPDQSSTVCILSKSAPLVVRVLMPFLFLSPSIQQFKVDPRIRLHNQLSKMEVIQAVASALPSIHKADLTKPDYVINVEILKMTVGIGILPRYDQYKRYNPQMVAQKYNEDNKDDPDALASRTLLVAEKPVAEKPIAS